jgi:hypothetical protein
MNLRPSLRLEACSYQAAKYAVEHWHYSKTMPLSRMVKIGVWEGGEYKGVVIFAWGANRNIASPFGLQMVECVELVRIALTDHITEVSKIISIATKMLKRHSPGVRLIISYADQRQGHHGGIYQAAGWIYAGETPSKIDYILHGKILQRRAYTGSVFGKPKRRLPKGAEEIRVPPKHRYLMPLDGKIRSLILPYAKPYPKRLKDSSEPSANHAEEGGATPTQTLHSRGVTL